MISMKMFPLYGQLESQIWYIWMKNWRHQDPFWHMYLLLVNWVNLFKLVIPWFSIEGGWFLSSRGHLTVTGDIFCCHSRTVVLVSGILPNIIQCTEQILSQIIIWATTSVTLFLKNSGLITSPFPTSVWNTFEMFSWCHVETAKGLQSLGGCHGYWVEMWPAELSFHSGLIKWKQVWGTRSLVWTEE